jgi:GNAT superfamily N-acetyltransferase
MQTMSIAIRRATPADSHILTEIAHAAKRHWGYPERWIIQWKEVLSITPEFVSTNEVYVATQGDKEMGFYALLLSNRRAVLEHMWVDPASIGGGIGRALFDHAVRTAASLNACEIEIESDPNAEGFYLRMGARRVGEVVSVLEGQTRVLPRLIFVVSAPDSSSVAESGFSA